MTTEKKPFVSIILPCRNEESFLPACLDSILSNDYPKDCMEIILADGMSTDRTVAIAGEYRDKETGVPITILKNPKLFFPCAVNLGVGQSRGDYIMIIGAHAVYDAAYVSSTIEAALRTGAENTGGVLITEGLNTTLMGKAITYVLSSPFGVGNSTFRTGSDKETEVDTVFGGCYRREVFEKIGLFNENLVSTSDMDFNTRLKKSGGKIILTPAAKAHYYTRTDFKKFVRNNFRNGYWSLYPLRFLKYLPVRFRHLIPLLFVCGLLVGGALSFFVPYIAWLYGVCVLVYLHLAIFASLRYVHRNILNLFLMQFLFITLHITYGLGSLLGLLHVIFSKPKRTA